MSSGRVQRPQKRRASDSPSPTKHLSLGLQHSRRRYQEASVGNWETPANIQNTHASQQNSTSAAGDAGLAAQIVEVMVVNKTSSTRDCRPRDDHVKGECNSAALKKLHSASRISRQKQLESKRKNKRFLHIQRAVIADSDGDRPLHLAVVHRDGVLVRQLCAMLHTVGAPLDACNYMRQTPLHLAVILSDSLMVEVLLEEGSSLRPRDSRGNTPIHLAAKNSSTQCLDVILRCSPAEAGDLINERNFEGKTSLHIAVSESNVDAVRALAKAGCDINSGDGKSGRTALTHAIYDRNISMIRLLLQNGASPDTQDYAGNTSHTAAAETDEEIVDILGSHGRLTSR